MTSATPTENEQIEFKIDCTEYSAGKRTYDNNNNKLAQSLIGQCALPVTDVLQGMKGHDSGQYDVLWFLSALNQMCSGIRNNQIPCLQTYNAIHKVFTHKQQHFHTAATFNDEFEQNIRAIMAAGATITLSLMCLELGANLNPDKTNPLNDDVKQARASLGTQGGAPRAG